MRFHYVSPSLLPSRAANAVHVALQCEGLARAGAEVTLYAKRSVADPEALAPALAQAFGVDATGWRLETFHSVRSRGDNVRIAALALRKLARERDPVAILSRNLYAAFVLGVLRRRPVLFETHQLESGARGAMQRALLARPWVTTVAISQELLHCIAEHHGLAPVRPLVLHDAAREGITPLPPAARRAALGAIAPDALEGWDGVCGYFGHLYPGRGIEIIDALAARRPRCLFLVFGGQEADIAARRAACRLPNLRFVGHVPHPVAQLAMAAVDALLMPYQRSVSIGVAGHDTARWMSPMKMFEYLASGVPIISSDLPVLREVLHDGRNCLLVAPDDPDAWAVALDRLIAAPDLAAALGDRGHRDYREHHTWTVRARRLLEAARMP